MQVAETSTGQDHDLYNYKACPEQKLHLYHRL